MPDVPHFVVDASVATKWHLHDEVHAQSALNVLRDFRDGMTQLLAPDHILYEVPGAVLKAVRRGRVPLQDGELAISQFLSWGITTIPAVQLIGAAYKSALRFGCSLYDALYVALAIEIECYLVTADQHLVNALGNAVPRLLWIEEYRLS